MDIGMQPSGHWDTLTREENALDYFERGVGFLGEMMSEPTSWKWAAIALQGALYGFAICACMSASYKSVMFETKSGERLIGVHEAVSRCRRRKYMERFVDSGPIKLSKEERHSITFIVNEIRNNVEHMNLGLWSIHLPSVVVEAELLVGVIAKIVKDTGCVFFDGEGQQGRFSSALDEYASVFGILRERLRFSDGGSLEGEA